MSNNKNNNPRNNDKPRIRAKPHKFNTGFPDSDSSVKSPTSTSSTSEHRNCVFVRDVTGYGFKITGNAPVKVQAVRLKGSAWNAGLRANDIILKVNGENVIDKQHSDVVGLIRKQTTVDLLVKSGDQIPTSNISHIPTRTNQTSPSLNAKTPSIEIEKPEPGDNKSISRPSPASNFSSPGESLNQSVISPNSLSDRSGRLMASDSSSECSISTSSTETDGNPTKNSRSKLPTQKTISTEFSFLPKKPQVAPKPKIDVGLILNKAPTDQVNVNNMGSPSDSDIPIKSHSYSASTKPSKLFQNSKKIAEGPRNKTIPTDKVKSNIMLRNDIDDIPFEASQVSFSTLPKQLTPHKSNNMIQKSKSISNNVLILGRDFDNDDKNDDDSDISLSIVDLLASAKDATSRPGLVSILLQYVNEQPNDLNVMMLYYACQFYKSFKLKKDFTSDAPRLANEIITTFILEKSPLFVTVESDIVEEILKKLKSTENMNAIFNALTIFLFQRLETIVEHVRGKILRGMLMQTDLPSLGNEENRDVEMGLLHRTLCNIYNKNAKSGDLNDFVLAKYIGLATIYQYFLKPLSLQTNNMRSRSIDCINTVGNQAKMLPIADVFKVTIFCSAYQQKMFSSIRKKPKSINGHTVIDAVCSQPEECAVCDGLLWGPSPQGLFCTMCQNYFHLNCKKKIKSACSRKSRRSLVMNGPREVPEKPPTSFLGRLSRKSSTSSVKYNNSMSTDNNTNHTYNNSPLIPDDKTNMNIIEDGIGVFKAKSEDQLHRIVSNAERFGSFHDVSSLNFNQSLDSNAGDTGSVQIQELVTDESIDDPDMRINESFDAGAEIQAVFPNIRPETDQKRLIVLLEFYHKTRYILMNLKRFLYKLVLKWPQTHIIYFKSLSLDCIEPFVNLIKSLVTTIESCIDDQDFVDLEIAVYKWLSDKNDKRLKEWITLSSNLCCTNSLYIVKQLKQTTMRAVPELVHLMNVKLHKMVIIEELTQIRPLLISLPLIVKNIIKCFTKSEPQYTEQLSIWKDVSVKMDYLCEYIDRCCIPLVDWINNGSIGKRSDKNDWPLKLRENENINPDIINYCIDFPRTLFHFPIFDFQMAKIFSWSRNTKRMGMDFRINYLKKGTEVLLIFYKSLIIVLQKENDHYYLKPIKPFKNITERLYPFIETIGFIATNGGQEEDSYILNIINKNPEDASLVRVGFTRREFVDNWLDYFGNDTQNLARSISLYKLNDIKEISPSNMPTESNNSGLGMKLKTSESFSSGQSNHTPSTNLIANPLATPNQEILPVDPAEKVVIEKPIVPVELLTALRGASEVINDQKQELCKFLNIPEDHYDNALGYISSGGPKTLQDMTLLFYSLCCPIVDNTRQLISTISGEIDTDPKINKIEIRKNLASISNLLQHFESLNYPGDENVKTDANSEDTIILPQNVEKEQSSAPRIQLVPDIPHLNDVNGFPAIEIIEQVSSVPESAAMDSMTPSEIIEDIKEIINDVIDKSVDQVLKLPVPQIRTSYKYVPEKCLISTSRDSSERSSINLTPSFLPISNPAEEIITTTRAQFILNRSANNN